MVKHAYIVLCCIFPLTIFCQHFLQKEQKAGDTKLAYTRVTVGSALSFYNNNNFHSANTRSGAAFFANVSEEVRIYKDLYFVGGLEYQHSAMSFDSYYFTPGYLALYNGHYDNNYSLTLQEGRLDLLLRLTGGNEQRKQITFYGEAGYVLRYLINTHLKVTSNANGQTMFNGTTHPEFDNSVFSNAISSGIKVNLGIQHNFLRSHHAWYIQVGLMYGLAPFLIYESFTPSSLNIKTTYSQIGLGYKF
ncbi:MAG: hypothetical protein ACYDCN_03260 [Bacteroidia bacterium]